MKTTLFSVLAILALAATPSLQADIQNGLSVTAVKKTSDRLTGRGYYDTTTLTQDLKVDIKNTGIKPYAAGEMHWTILVHSRYYSSSMMKYKGTDPVKALRAGEGVELAVGGFETESVRTYSGTAKDKIEYQLIIVHAGKETYRFQTTASFEAMAKKATTASRGSEDPDRKSSPTKEPEPEKKVTPPPVVKPIAAPRTPTSPTTPPPVAPPPVAPPPVADPAKKPVDFFNLDGK